MLLQSFLSGYRFAFVEFSSQDDATKAMESFQGTEIDGRAVRLSYAMDRQGGGGGGRGKNAWFLIV